MRKVRRLLLLAAFFLSLGGVSYKVYETVSQTRVNVKKDPLQVLDYLPDSALHVKDFRRAKVENGRKVWEVMGEEADYFKDQKEAVIKKPRFVYYDQDGNASEASGETARMFLSEKQLERLQLEGGIQLIYQDYVLRSEKAIYFSDTQTILMPSHTILASDGLQLEGASMEVELETKKVRLLQSVKTKIEPGKLAKKQQQPKAKTAIGG